MLGGGRYDGLVGLFGVAPVPTVGFGWGDVTLANFLASLDRGKVRTVAYIPAEALADASIVAMVMLSVVLDRAIHRYLSGRPSGLGE